MKQTTTLILVADAAHARFIETHRVEGDGGLRQVDVVNNVLHPSHEIGSDKPGRSFDSGPNAQRHAMAPGTDLHKEEKLHFADRLAARLNADALAARYDRLIVVAPPVMLGEIRSALDKHAQEKLTHTIAKDLTHVPLDELPSHFKQ
jgi:protein required for attachment to host cells